MDRIIAARVFTTISEQGSLIGAATRLDMSRAMVTRYLAQMENWAGARLLHRTTRKLGLTSAGEATLLRCREILALCDDVPLAAGADQPQGMLRIAASQSIGQSLLAGALASYLALYPRMQVDLHIGNTMLNLVEARIDLAIRITNQLDPNLIARQLGSCESVVCASPAYLARHGTPQTLAELSRHNCLTYRYFGNSVWEFDSDTIPKAIPVSGNLSANDSVVLLQAAVAGAGVTLQPVFSALPLMKSGQLVALLPRHRPQQMGIHGIYTSRQHMPAGVRSMLDFLVEWFSGDEYPLGVNYVPETNAATSSSAATQPGSHCRRSY